jgi:hypothetical protein
MVIILFITISQFTRNNKIYNKHCYMLLLLFTLLYAIIFKIIIYMFKCFSDIVNIISLNLKISGKLFIIKLKLT